MKKDDKSRTGAVYKMTCLVCESRNVVSTYIGETGRELQIRMNEHFKCVKDQEDYDKHERNLSQVCRHMYNKHKGVTPNNNWKVEILKTSNRVQIRKILEALEIQSHRPTLNVDGGLSVIV